jgi:hypothetical protein
MSACAFTLVLFGSRGALKMFATAFKSTDCSWSVASSAMGLGCLVFLVSLFFLVP